MKKLYNDDCFNVFPLIKDKSVNMVLVDLPYGQTDCHWDICLDLVAMWKELKRIGTDNCQYVFFTTTKYGYELISSNKRMFKYDLVWEKPLAVGFLSAKHQPLRAHEMIYIFNKKKLYNIQMTEGEPYKKALASSKGEKTVYGNIPPISNENFGNRYPRSVIKFHNKGKKLHPTQKPLDLCEWLIKTYSNEGDLVLDFCMGSGSTIVACINTNRQYIGIEKDKEIYKIARERIKGR